MAHRFPPAALLLAVSTLLPLAACTVDLPTADVPRSPRVLAPALGTTQRVHDQRMTYVFCEAPNCTTATPKRAAVTVAYTTPDAAQVAATEAAATQSLEAPFGPDSATLRAADEKRLRDACANSVWSRVHIVGRADRHGSHSARQQAAARRAATLARLVKRCAPHSATSTGTAISAPTTTGQHAAQRGGTVTFFP